ncbi:MAG: glycosyltransferase family 9 protein [Bacteroidetes bacterium]|nr:glycosyltransferase family 9 protein [Bacteroidota bacterium]
MKVLIIQTAFLGDVILATSLVETLAKHIEKVEISILVNKKFSSALANNPNLESVFEFDKSKPKVAELRGLIKKLKKEHFTHVINCHRFASSGIIAANLKANRIGFAKNPFSMFFHKKVEHQYKEGLHEIDRNFQLINHLVDASTPELPKLYPSKADLESVEQFLGNAFITISPGSVWKTKQYETEGWLEFIKTTTADKVYLLGAHNEVALCNDIKNSSNDSRVEVLAGKLSLLQVSALMPHATMNYANDSAPTHIASATNSPITTVFCSTAPSFGFYPLGTKANVAQTSEQLSCKPCGIHGKKKCPEGHFLCGKFSLTSK